LTAPAPNQRWVARLHLRPTWGGFVFVAFIVDVYAQRIVGWHAVLTFRGDPSQSSSLRAADSKDNRTLVAGQGARTFCRGRDRR
jgi:transposase InsO family protein